MRTLRILLAVSLIACGGDHAATDPTVITFAGDYTAKSVDGQPLPYVLAQSGTTSVTVLDANLAVIASGVWTQTMHVRTVTPTTTATTVVGAGGTWIRSGNQLGFIDGSTNTTYYTGTFSSNRLDLNDGQLNIVFTK